MVYYGYSGQEIEDAEMDNMRRDSIQDAILGNEADLTVIIKTQWPDVVKSCINMQALGGYGLNHIDGSILTLKFHDDTLYREMSIWLGSALACGLILRGEIER